MANNKEKPLFISTAIPYVNGAPHIGHALEFVETDIIARFHRLEGREVFFLSGTDDNALKNVQAAEAVHMNVSQYVAEQAAAFENLGETLNASNDDFIKTSQDKRHFPGAQKLWSACKSEDIYKKKYKGLYCVGCEEFKTEKELVNGECPEHPGKKLEEVEEENYFFKLSNYQKQLEDLIASDRLRILPLSRKNEALSFIRGGLEDFSISRSSSRARGWGVPVPGDSNQIMYVWFDALANYITALNYAEEGELYQKFWKEGERVHVIGKGINRFHTIYWPAMLLSAGVPIPSAVFIHGYITVDGQKMSKSVGNVVDPFDVISEWGTDAFRFYFSKEVSPFEDGDFSFTKFSESYTAHLANGLGNLASRVIKMAHSYNVSLVEQDFKDSHLYVPWKEALEAFDIQRAANLIWEEIGAIDKAIGETEPFKLVKTNPEEAKALVGEYYTRLFVLSKLLSPFLPETAKKLEEGIRAGAIEPLFPRKE